MQQWLTSLRGLNTKELIKFFYKSDTWNTKIRFCNMEKSVFIYFNIIKQFDLTVTVNGFVEKYEFLRDVFENDLVNVLKSVIRIYENEIQSNFDVNEGNTNLPFASIVL